MYSARRNKPMAVVGGSIVFAIIIYWIGHHIAAIVGQRENLHNFVLIYNVSFLMLLIQTITYNFERPYTTTKVQARALNKLRVVVNVPTCNEDATALQECLKSLVHQSRPANVIHVVVNGANKVDYTEVKKQSYKLQTKKTRIHWTFQEIAGKRHAQATTIRRYLRNKDIFLTVDSDAYLDYKAIEEGMKPLADSRVQSVAGIVLNSNNRAALLTRLSDLWFLTAQLVDRSSYSAFGSVLVNSGVLAFYRAPVVKKNLDGYLNETFFGRPVQFSDDSMLTLYAIREGRTVQQPTSFCFTLMPEKLSHHFRQQVRWMRGSFIRSWWRFKYLPLTGYAYWAHFFRWLQMIVASIMFVLLFIVLPATNHTLVPWLLAVPLVISYSQGLRYLTVSRNDESFGYRFATYLMQPICMIWAYFVLRGLRWYAMATCLKTGWGTRKEVEVSVGQNIVAELA